MSKNIPNPHRTASPKSGQSVVQSVELTEANVRQKEYEAWAVISRVAQGRSDGAMTAEEGRQLKKSAQALLKQVKEFQKKADVKTKTTAQ